MFLYYYHKKTIIYSTFVGAVLMVVLLLPGRVWATEVQFSPTAGTYPLGQTFTTTVLFQPDADGVNAIDVSLEFDPSILSVVSIDKNQNDFTYWTTEPTFSNSLGTIDFGGVGKAPFTSPVELIDLTFRALAPGDGELSVVDASAYATNGLRTNVSVGSDTPATFRVSSATENINEPETLDSVENSVNSPVVYSEEFFDTETWFNSLNGTFTWQLDHDTEAVAVEIANDFENRPNNNPEAIYEDPITEFVATSDELTEGIQYLSLRFRDSDGWGEILNRKILIDTLPPEPFAIEVVGAATEDFPTLFFETVDLTSGVERYEILVPEREIVVISTEDAKYGYKLKELIDGEYTIIVNAYDRAGNLRQAQADVEIMAGWTQAVAASEIKDSRYFLSNFPNLSVYLLLTILVLLLVHIHFERKKLLMKEAKLTKETQEIQTQMEKIFTALRDEICDQINTISKRKRLSKAEKEAVEGLHQAVEVSQSLIEKEINDVKKVLK